MTDTSRFPIVLAAATALLGLAAGPARADDPTEILFVGNSFTHGRYDPALNYNAGPGNATGTNQVHDLLCPSLPCTGAEGPAPAVPTSANTPGGSLPGQLGYLQNNPSSQYTEVGPFGGVAGIFLQLTKEAGLNYDVSLVAVSSATLTGYANNTGSEAGDLPLIENSKYSKVVLQDQSFQPLPSTITVNGQTVPTRGKPTSFDSGVNTLVKGIDAADKAAGKPYAAITLAQTPPLASYGYTSTNPKAPIFGTSTVAQQGGNKAYAPYVGDANPIAAMASDLHDAYESEAAAFNAANPTKSHVGVALDGDAWVTAINQGIAQQDPFLANEPAGQIDLWDSDPLLACCTVPIGYHPSVYGDYLNALTLFGQITGIDPTTVTAEVDYGSPLFQTSAANALGISGAIADELAGAAEATLRADGPASVPEPGSVVLLVTGLAGFGAYRFRQGRDRGAPATA
ncbi:MAG TPA: PEP-CTERM sorting domain-containing protein [Aliidongia sp.]|uniref:PEP-CTERM sorting domain-containing protein n=1 Tax=Aliidongia sp. TaxID=1914230 RepID=UPI002DDD740F|nr:PEP-CTERM sorting domain-containing protein [Aliidongia sp.]HEV2675504.1 PEP-CTERM sorting domain-containing protein [Aliidongia sp.]